MHLLQGRLPGDWGAVNKSPVALHLTSRDEPGPDRSVVFIVRSHCTGPVLHEFANAAFWLGNWRDCPGPRDHRRGSSLRQEQEEAAPRHRANTAIH